MRRREVQNPLAVIYYDEEKDQVLFETFPTKPGITVRPAEVAGMCHAVAQWFLSKLQVHSSGISPDIEDTLRDLANETPDGSPPKRRQPFVLSSTLCVCGHTKGNHLPHPDDSCMSSGGCPCPMFRRAD